MSTLEPGQLFAKDFQVERRLSEGGMGAVYVARQLSTDKLRALKLMHPQLAPDARSRQRFVDEARIGGRIDSEHVVEVVAAGIDEVSGAPWLAMELLEGEDLGDLSQRRGALPVGEVRDAFLQAGHALGQAHDKGIVHRDLKPENLFLARARREGAASVVKVLDFGIALALPSGGAGVVTTTVGSPFWMAPEQAKPGATLTPATDVWALGLIAFQFLSGGSYWRTAKQNDASIGAVLTEILVEPLDLASKRAAELGLRVPPAGFDDWFTRCVSRDASARFADARSCLAALDALLARVAPRAPLVSSRAVTETAASGVASVGFDPTMQRATPPFSPPEPQPVAADAFASTRASPAVPSSAAPSSAAPLSAAPSSAAPSSAAPSSAAPSSAVPASAVPASAVPSSAVPSSAVPSSAVPSSAVPSSAVPSSAVPSSAVPSSAVPSSAVPSSAVPSSAVPSSAVPSSAVPASPRNAGSRWMLVVGVLLATFGLVRTLTPSAATPAPSVPPPIPSLQIPTPPPTPVALVAPPPAAAVVGQTAIDAGEVPAVAVVAPVVKHVPPPPPITLPTKISGAERVAGEKCPQRHITVVQARAHVDELCELLDQWDIVRLAGGGSMDGRGYQCKVHEHDARELGFSLCQK